SKRVSHRYHFLAGIFGPSSVWYSFRLPAPPLRPSSAARSGSEWRAHKAPPRTAGAAHWRPALVVASHPPFAVSCRLSGMGATPWNPDLRGARLRVYPGDTYTFRAEI